MSPEQVADSLTEAQRDTLLDGRRCVRSYRPAQKLIDLGIWDGDGDEYTIYPSCTPLGLSVKRILEDRTTLSTAKGADHAG